MKQTPARSTPARAADPESSDPFAWPRMPTPPLIQIPFDLEAAETEGDTPCD
jgi:hypothetical protein